MIDTESDAFKAACRGFARGLAEDKTLGDILTTALEAYLAAMPKEEWQDIATAVSLDRVEAAQPEDQATLSSGRVISQLEW
jgi:hypothetical protein